jgi:ribonuclease P protein component
VVRKTPEGFPWHYRIVRGADYRAAYSAGLRCQSGSFILFGKENHLGHHRLGITVSRKVGSAVARNRAKRLFREIFRKSVAAIPDSLDLVVNAKRECAGAAYRNLRKEFLSAVERLRLQIGAAKQNKCKEIQDLPGRKTD